jgi:uncharacterized protein YcbK (DUF882 family)
MQGWARNATTDATNEELRRFRKELTRSERAPLRVIVAGDPTKPVLSFTVPRSLPRTIAIATLLSSAAAFLGGWRHAAPPGAWASDAVEQMAATATAEMRQAGPAAEEPKEARAESPAKPEKTAAAPANAAFGSAPASAAAALPVPKTEPPARAAGAKGPPEHFTVEISNTGKTIEVLLSGPAGEPDDESYRSLRHELRCQRTGAENPIDPRMIELLHQISVRTASRIQIVSAFRAPLFPRDLNYHVRGMAADIRVPGLSTIELRDLARSLGATGVGYYPTVQFVHVDVREVPYFWTDTSGHNEKSHESAADVTAASEASGDVLTDSAPSQVPPSAPTPSYLLPSVSATTPSPVRTPAQNAADRLGLPSGAQ